MLLSFPFIRKMTNHIFLRTLIEILKSFLINLGHKSLINQRLLILRVQEKSELLGFQWVTFIWQSLSPKQSLSPLGYLSFIIHQQMIGISGSTSKHNISHGDLQHGPSHSTIQTYPCDVLDAPDRFSQTVIMPL